MRAMERFSPSPSISPIRVGLRVFLVVALLVGGYLAYTAFYSTSPLEKALYRLGYPSEGYIVENGTIRFADGHIAIQQGAYLETYPITAAEALQRAQQYLADYNLKLKQYNMKLVIDPESLTEKQQGQQLYWVFELKLKKGVGSGWYVGTVWVDRKTGLVMVKGILG